MNYRSLETKLNTHATTAGISKYLFGYLPNADADNRAGTYPFMIVIPVYKPLKVESSQEYVDVKLEVYILDNWKREDTATRTQTWDLIDAKMLAFVTAVNASSDLEVRTTPVVDGEIFPFGLSTDSVIAIRYDLNLRVWC